MEFVLVVGGLVALYFGAEWLLKGAISLAKMLGMPTLLVSLVIVGFGTSMPELLVSVSAALSGSPAIALGNVVGSSTANILLILGVGALIYPMHKWDGSAPINVLIMTGVALLTLLFVQFDVIGRLPGLIMLALLSLYLFWSYKKGRADGESAVSEEVLEPVAPLKITIPQVIGGLIVLFAGAEMLVRGATSIARDFGISEAVIGLTVVAVGTSLPELATAAIAAFRRNPDIAIGNVIGSNIFNILGILGVTVVIHPISVDRHFAYFDVPVMVAASLAFTALLYFGKPIGRLVGGTLVASYAVYTALLF
ncbi:calcium/sodium antiporter [Rhizobium sp. L1K21]|uniref:calcium/sodium antiporter n=1 Tax=Rhizobium sp. L1K21 TaxID=2954933 RepID=UPI0020920C8E|nr:calcium/sodium antiporter [Rhizobium sp. L1K21]MCO6186529.1 calcium/sodium antiporter [Rhizobium sp. L1K21]